MVGKILTQRSSSHVLRILALLPALAPSARPEKECSGPIVETEWLILILQRQLANDTRPKDFPALLKHVLSDPMSHGSCVDMLREEGKTEVAEDAGYLSQESLQGWRERGVAFLGYTVERSPNSPCNSNSQILREFTWRTSLAPMGKRVVVGCIPLRCVSGALQPVRGLRSLSSLSGSALGIQLRRKWTTARLPHTILRRQRIKAADFALWCALGRMHLLEDRRLDLKYLRFMILAPLGAS